MSVITKRISSKRQCTNATNAADENEWHKETKKHQVFSRSISVVCSPALVELFYNVASVKTYPIIHMYAPYTQTHWTSAPHISFMCCRCCCCSISNACSLFSFMCAHKISTWWERIKSVSMEGFSFSTFCHHQEEMKKQMKHRCHRNRCVFAILLHLLHIFSAWRQHGYICVQWAFTWCHLTFTAIDFQTLCTLISRTHCSIE